MANQYLNKTGLTRLVYKIKTLIQDMSKEAYLVWGGKNVAGDVSPVDAAACDDTNANRLAFHPADCIDVEYSTDGGSTWLDYEATDVNKTTFVTTSNYFYIGKKSASKATINDKLRITLTAKANHHYWQCQKLLMWISTSGANDCKVLVETRHINETSFSQYGEYNIIGWGGWNSIPLSAYFSAQTNTGHVHKIRLTFTAGSVSGDYNSNLSIGKLRMIAPTCYLNANGELGLNGRIYSLSADKSVTFPNKVTATSFVGATATSTSSGLMSAADKKNLDELPTTKISSSATSKGVKVSLGGTVKSPTISIETTTNGVASNNSGVVSGAEVKDYVDTNAASTATFKSQTSSSNAVNGLVPAPTLANSQKYLRGDGTWQTPTNTTYSFAGGTNKFTVTPSGGTAQEVSVTPSIANNVTYSGTLTSGQVAVLDGTAGKIKASGYTIAKSVPSNALFTDTTYSGMTAEEATSGSSATNRLISPKVLQDKIDSEILAIPVMTGATSTTTGVAGFVPAPASGQQKKYLRGDGVWSNDFLYKTAYNYINGCLVKTNIGYREIAQSQFIIKGNSYYNNVGIFTFGQFYNYVETNKESIVQGAATMCGFDFGNIYVFHYNNVVYLWFTQPPTTSGSDSYMTFEVYVSTHTSQENRVVEITHSKKPTSGVTKEITITPVARLGTESVGNATQPIYLQNGRPKECTYTIQKSVPSNAVFTDTHYTAKNVVTNSAGAIETAAASNGDVHINLVENGTWRSGINISGSGATLVTSDEWGNIKITSDDTKYSAMKGATSSNDGASGLVPKPLKTQQEYFLRGDGTWTSRINEFGYTGAIDIGTSFSNATGWFRIARARYLRSTSSVFRVAIYRNYSYAVPEAYVFDICTSYHTDDPISITQVAGQASTIDGNKLIDKIRVTRDTSSSDSIVYFDFHVNLSKTANTFFWYVIGNAESYTSSAVVRNPTITSTTETYEFTTVNGFKTNGDIEGDSRFRSKMRSNPQTSSGVMFDTAPMLINGFIPYTNTEIVEAPSGDTSLFGISYLNTSYGNYTSDETFYFTPGEKIKVECWLRRDVGADKYVDENGVTKTRTKGTFYLGMRFKDKKGHYVSSNEGTEYFDGMLAYQCPCDGKWHHLETEYTIPEKHTPYIIRDKETNAIISQSDGGGYYTGTIRSMINYPVSGTNGNTPTYILGLRITKVAPSASVTNKGIQIKLDGSPYIPTPTIVVTTGGVAANNSGVVSGAEVKEYVDANKGVSTVFQAQTSSSNAVNGLVPAPSSANTQKYLRGDGTWQTPTNTTYSAGSGLSLTGTTFAADGNKIINNLSVGTSPALREDYIVAQYAGGGTTTTSYHRRSLANIFAALNKSDITTALGYTPPTLSDIVQGDGSVKYIKVVTSLPASPSNDTLYLIKQ